MTHMSKPTKAEFKAARIAESAYVRRDHFLTCTEINALVTDHRPPADIAADIDRITAAHPADARMPLAVLGAELVAVLRAARIIPPITD